MNHVILSGIEVVDTSDPRFAVHRLHDGSSLSIVTAPLDDQGRPTPESNEAGGASAPMLKAFSALEAARQSVKNDPDLSESGRAKRIKGPHAAAMEAISGVESRLALMAVETATAQERALAPDALKADDIGGIMTDREIRDYVNSLSADERTSYLQTLRGNRRHLDAIARSPVPVPVVVGEYAARLRAEMLENTPAMIAVRNRMEAADWLRVVVDALKPKI